MKDIKYIIAKNLIALRKERHLTQEDLAKELSYSDNMVSRWERMEITPNIETLQKISEFYNVPIAYILQENAVKKSAENEKMENMKKFSIVLLLLTVIWFIAAITYVYYNAIIHENSWLIFVFAVPVSCLILLLFNGSWKLLYLYRFIVLSTFIWSFLAFIYLYFLSYNIFLVFIIGVPAQAALIIWAFIKPKKKKKTDIK